MRASARSRMPPWPTVGWVAKYDYLENAFVEDQQTGERYLLIVSVPMPEEASKVPMVETRLGRFGAAILKALRRAPDRGSGLQPDVGPPLTVRAIPVRGGRRVRLRLGVTGADGIRGWLGHRPLPRPRAEPSTGKTHWFVLELPLPPAGGYVLVLRTTRGNAPVGYSSFVLEVGSATAPISRVS